MNHRELEISVSSPREKTESPKIITHLKAALATMILVAAGCSSSNAKSEAYPESANMTPQVRSKLKNDWKTILGADQRLLQVLLNIEKSNQRYNRVDQVLAERIAEQMKKVEADQKTLQTLEGK